MESLLVYRLPEKAEDPRVPARSKAFTIRNVEVAFFSLPLQAGARNHVVERSTYNGGGEKSSAWTSYSGIPIRRLCELPRMAYAVKQSILGPDAAGSLRGMKRVQKDIDLREHPFSLSEVKPLALWQNLLEHLGITHIVDFTPGSGGLAIVAAGAAKYDGLAAGAKHKEWLDTVVDQCIAYKVARDKTYGEVVLGDRFKSFSALPANYFSGTILQARRMLEPIDDQDDAGSDTDEESELAE